MTFLKTHLVDIPGIPKGYTKGWGFRCLGIGPRGRPGPGQACQCGSNAVTDPDKCHAASDSESDSAYRTVSLSRWHRDPSGWAQRRGGAAGGVPGSGPEPARPLSRAASKSEAAARAPPPAYSRHGAVTAVAAVLRSQ